MVSRYLFDTLDINKVKFIENLLLNIYHAFSKTQNHYKSEFAAVSRLSRALPIPKLDYYTISLNAE